MKYLCGWCGERKKFDDMVKDKRRQSGCVSRCKKCENKDQKRNLDYYRAWRENHREQERVRGLKYWRKHKKQYKIYEKCRRHSVEVKARQKLRNAITDGRIKKPSICEECKSKKILHGHHDDYTKPLEVRWLCSECHGVYHQIALAESETKGGMSDG